METLEADKSKLASHFHNTYDRALENIVISLAHGISTFDSSVGGLGGCPYAKGATGNVATEDVLLMMEILGVKTGVDINEIINIGDSVTKELKIENRSSVSLEDLDNIEVYRKMLI